MATVMLIHGKMACERLRVLCLANFKIRYQCRFQMSSAYSLYHTLVNTEYHEC